jgi:hypothetical protein
MKDKSHDPMLLYEKNKQWAVFTEC